MARKSASTTAVRATRKASRPSGAAPSAPRSGVANIMATTDATKEMIETARKICNVLPEGKRDHSKIAIYVADLYGPEPKPGDNPASRMLDQIEWVQAQSPWIKAALNAEIKPETATPNLTPEAISDAPKPESKCEHPRQRRTPYTVDGIYCPDCSAVIKAPSKPRGDGNAENLIAAAERAKLAKRRQIRDGLRKVAPFMAALLDLSDPITEAANEPCGCPVCTLERAFSRRS